MSPKRKRIPDLYFRTPAGNDLVSHMKTCRRYDISFLAVPIMKKSYPCSSIRIVLYRAHLRRYSYLIPFKINDSESPSVAAAPVP